MANAGSDRFPQNSPQSSDGSARPEMGKRIRDARIRLRMQLKALADAVSMGDAQLSRIESGSLALPCDRLSKLSQFLGVSPEYLLYGEPPTQPGSLRGGLDLLRAANEFGTESLHRDRHDAMSFLVPFAKDMYEGEIKITGSSLRGLWSATTHPFIQEFTNICHSRPQVQVRCMLTHPRIAHSRETQEGAPHGTIALEVLRGLRWLVEDLRIPVVNMRLCRAHPSTFSLFLHGMSVGRAIITCYPIAATAFESITTGIRRLSPNEEGAARSQYSLIMAANFDRPFGDANIAVGVLDGLRECLDIVEAARKSGAGSIRNATEREVETLTKNSGLLREVHDLCSDRALGAKPARQARKPSRQVRN